MSLDAEEHGHPPHAGVGEDVTIETCERAHAEAGPQQTIPGQAGVDDRDRRAGASRRQLFREQRRPRPIAVERHADAIGD